MLQSRLPSIAVSILLVVSSVAVAASGSQTSSDLYQDQLVPKNAVPLLPAPPVNRSQVDAEDEQRRQLGLPMRFAVPNAVQVNTLTDGLWEEVDANTSVWRLRVGSSGAVSLNLGFTSYFMPEGGRLIVHADDGKMIRPFTADDNAAHGELWTPPLEAEEVVIEVTLPTNLRSRLQLELTHVGVGYLRLGDDPTLRSGSCNNDVVCPEGIPWQDEIQSVALIAIGGFLNCSGFMVNNTSGDQTPYFMTAFHCGLNAGNAASLVAIWNFETSTCGGTPDGVQSDFQTGSFFRSGYSPSDFTLVELDEDPDPDWSVAFAGWDRSGANASSAVAIHHPSLDEKRISFENNPTSTTTYFGTASPGNGTHVRVADWDDGTTEGGSSGSPLFDPNHRVIGQLHGGTASCTSQTSDWYGKLSVSWTGGGSSSTRLSNWLDPGGTGAVTVDTLAPANPRLAYVSHVVDDVAGGNGNGIAEPGETVVLQVDVENTGAVPATLVSGTLSTVTPLVSFPDALSTWPDIPNQTSAGSTAPHFTVQLDPGFPCGNAIFFTLNHAAVETPGAWVSQFVMTTGATSCPVAGFSDDMESGTGSWSPSTLSGSNPWVQTTDESSSPTHSWFVADIAGISDSVLVSPSIDNPLELRFQMALDSEGGFDGGVLEYSTNGFTWLDAGPLITQVPYNVTISDQYGSPLSARSAWSGQSNGGVEVVVDLTALSGSSVQFRWRFATDSSVSAVGWYIDDVEFQVTTPTCALGAVPGEPSEPFTGSLPFTIAPDPGGYELAWDTPVSGGAVDEYVLYATPMAAPWANPDCEIALGSGLSAVVATLPDDSCFVVVARNASGESSYGEETATCPRAPATTGVCP